MTEDEAKNRDLALQTKALLPWIEIVRMKLWNFSSFENSSTYTILLNINIYQLTYLSKNFSFLCSFPDLYIELNFFTKNNQHQTTVPFQRPLAPTTLHRKIPSSGFPIFEDEHLGPVARFPSVEPGWPATTNSNRLKPFAWIIGVSLEEEDAR